MSEATVPKLSPLQRLLAMMVATISKPFNGTFAPGGMVSDEESRGHDQLLLGGETMSEAPKPTVDQVHESLLPCPFCGTQAAIASLPGNRYPDYVVAAEHWNIRADSIDTEKLASVVLKSACDVVQRTFEQRANPELCTYSEVRTLHDREQGRIKRILDEALGGGSDERP